MQQLTWIRPEKPVCVWSEVRDHADCHGSVAAIGRDAGAVSARFLFDRLRLRSPEVRGFALGLASHGIGTARAIQVNPSMGAFAVLGMGLNGILTALLMPSIVPRLIEALY